MKAESEFTNYDKTVVDFPVLTEENSFDLVELVMGDMEDGYYEEDYYEDYAPEYPLWYFSYETEKLMTEGEKIYVPLRTTLESAYEGNINLAYDNGVITVTSEYFKDYDKMVFSVGSGGISKGDKTVNTDAVIMEDGVTYISCDALRELFNWELEYADYDLINKIYYIGFWEFIEYSEEEFAA